MFISVLLGLFLLSLVSATPGFGYEGYLKAAPLLSAPILPAPVHAPIFAPSYIKSIAPAPILAHAPIIAPAPILAHAPIIKAIAPATSYASITQYHIAHATPIVKTIAVAAPPIYKSYIPASLDYGHGYH